MVPSSRPSTWAGVSISLRASGVTPGKRCVQARMSSGISSQVAGPVNASAFVGCSPWVTVTVRAGLAARWRIPAAGC